MAEKLLIAVSAEGAELALWRGRRIASRAEFGADEAGQAAFREHLQSAPNAPVYLVVDAVEEDYRFETLPHAFGSERAEMVNRKLRQHYRNTPYVSAWRQGRESGKRRDDRYLFSALTNPEIVNAWLGAISARGLPVAGLYLLPMVAGALVERLEIQAPNVLIVAQHATGLRLTFFRERQFRLSRLTRGEAGRGEHRAQHFSEEISNTRLYLHALRTMTLDEHLTVVLLDRTDELAAVAAAIARDNPGLECVRVGRAALAARLGLAEELVQASPYAIYLHLLGSAAPQANLAPASVTVGHRRYQARRAIYGASAALALAAASWTGVNLYEVASLRAETRDAARESARISAEYLEITRRFPAAPASAENLKKTVEIAQRLRESARTPEEAMALVSRALEAVPNVVLREFGWRYGVTEIEPGTGARAQAAAPEAAAPAGGKAQRHQSVLIEGEIRPFRGDFRAAIGQINAFAERLSGDPRVAEVRVLKLPLNVNPGLALSGNTLDTPEQSASADFTLVIVLKAGV
jgi:hypothetical protein